MMLIDMNFYIGLNLVFSCECSVGRLVIIVYGNEKTKHNQYLTRMQVMKEGAENILI